MPLQAKALLLASPAKARREKDFLIGFREWSTISKRAYGIW